MRIVIALDGNALLRRSDPMTTEVQRRNVRTAAQAIVPLAAEHSIAVMDKDLASELLAEDIGADLFAMATDVDGVHLDWGGPQRRRLGRVPPEELAGYEFAAGSMGPKVEAAARFAGKTGRRAAIGSLTGIAGIVAGKAGTSVVARGAPEGAASSSYETRHTREDAVQTGKAGTAGS